MYTHILIPTDGSELAGEAVQHGIALAKWIGAKTTALTVLPPFHTFTTDAQMIEDTPAEYKARMQEHAGKTLGSVARAAQAAGVACEIVHVEHEHPYRAIIDTAVSKGMHGFQLWANLPSSQKMTAPRYQDIKAAGIPEIIDGDGTRVRVVCGEFWGKRGPVEGVAADPCYLDVFIPAGLRKALPMETGRNVFAYVFEGAGTFDNASQPFGVLTEKVVDGRETVIRERAGNRSLVLFDSGDEVAAAAGEEGMRFLLVSGKPLKEPVAWYGPIVMNTQAELELAARELQDGTFIKSR